MKKQLSLLVLALGVVSCRPAPAQIDNGLPGIQPFDVGSFVMNDHLLRLNLSNATRGLGSDASPKRSVRRPAPVAQISTTYRPSAAVTARVRQQFLNWISQKSGAEAAAKLGEEFQRKDYLQLWAQHVKSDGLKSGDVADAFTAYWVQNWMMANGVQYAPPAQVRAVRAQVVPIFVSNPAFRKLNAAQRQEMAEIFIYNQIVQGAAYTGAAQDQDMRRRLAEAAVARFKNEMGVDLRELKLTPQGFQSKTA